MASAYIKWRNGPGRLSVTGSGEFPMDMLRHSAAWPNTTGDALAILARGKRTIELRAAIMGHVSVDRWESFGWHCELVEDF